MEIAWLLFGLLGWAVAILLVLALMHMAGRQDHIARRVEMEISLGSGSPAPRPGFHTGSENARRIATGGSDPD
jgi:hypothetical protein